MEIIQYAKSKHKEDGMAILMSKKYRNFIRNRRGTFHNDKSFNESIIYNN